MLVAAGIVTVRRIPIIAKGKNFLLRADEHGQLQVIVQKKLADAKGEAVRHSQFLGVLGRFERDRAVLIVIAERFRVFGVAEMNCSDAACGQPVHPTHHYRQG